MSQHRHTPKPKTGEITHDEAINDDIEWVSKSEMKREAGRLDTLAGKLVALSAQQLPSDLLPEGVITAIKEARRLSKTDARKRQTRHIGRLLQQVSVVEAVQTRLDLFDEASEVGQQIHRLTEQWRDRLIAHPADLAAFIQAYPVLQRQELHQAVRRASRAESELARDPDSSSLRETARRHRHQLYQRLQPEVRARVAESVEGRSGAS